jgi:hypothetical protein
VGVEGANGVLVVGDGFDGFESDWRTRAAMSEWAASSFPQVGACEG